jgi:WD40 repeat protein
MRRIGLLLAVMLATTLGVVGSASARIHELRGSPYRIGPDALAFSPNGRWLAALDTEGVGPRWLWMMSVNTTTGRLQRVRGAPFVIGPPPALTYNFYPLSMAFSPDGRLLAVSMNSDNLRSGLPSAGPIDVFSVNNRTGVLHLISRKQDPNGNAEDIAFSPRGGLLAADDAGTKASPVSGVSLFTVNERTGALRYESRWVNSLNSYEMSFNPRGNLLAVTTYVSVTMLAVNSAASRRSQTLASRRIIIQAP